MSADRDDCSIPPPGLATILRTAATTDVARVAGAAAMLGIVTINPNTCTMCLMCTQTCPTGALAGGYSDDGELMMSFDPVDCTACVNASGCAPRWHASRSRWTLGADRSGSGGRGSIKQMLLGRSLFDDLRDAQPPDCSQAGPLRDQGDDHDGE